MSTATKPGTQMATRDDKFRNIRALLTKAQSQIALALPKHMTPDRMTRIALSAMSKNPLLLECTPESLVLSLINLSEVGLEPDGRLAYLLPYYNFNKALGKSVYEAQAMIDYKGFIQLGYRSGMISAIDAKAIHAKDVFDYRFGTNPFLDHKPADGDDVGELVGAYAVCTLLSGGHKFVVLNKRDIELRRAKSMGYLKKGGAVNEYSPWVTAPDAMWAKSAVRELYKWIPTSSEITRAVALDEAPDNRRRQLPENTDGLAALGLDMAQLEDQSTEEPEPTKADRVADRLAKPAAGELTLSADHPLHALEVSLLACKIKPEAAELKKQHTGQDCDPDLYDEIVRLCDAAIARLPMTAPKGAAKQKELA